MCSTYTILINNGGAHTGVMVCLKCCSYLGIDLVSVALLALRYSDLFNNFSVLKINSKLQLPTVKMQREYKTFHF